MAGSDLAEQILDRLQGRGSFKEYVLILVQLAHFETEMVTTFTYPEIAVAAILKTSDLLQDTVAADIIPSAMLSNRAVHCAEVLGRLAARNGISSFL